MYGGNETLIAKLQRVQNMAARVISRVSKNDHITPILYDLNWLTFQQRIVFRILVDTFKALHGQAFKYMSYGNMFRFYTCTQITCSIYVKKKFI